MKPSLGRIVLYEEQPAIITGVNDDGTVSLKVFNKIGLLDIASVAYSEEPESGKWTWPPRL